MNEQRSHTVSAGSDPQLASCPHCGDADTVDFLEIYPEDRSWQFTFCCEAFQDEYLWTFEMMDPEEKAAELERLGWSYHTGKRPRAVYDDCGHLEIDECLELRPIDWATARAFVDEHHSHNAAPIGWRFGFGVYNFGELVAIAMVGRPNARAIDHTAVVDVSRVCVKRTWGNLERHACSMLYGAACREAKARGFRKVISYTLEHERGTALKAAGFAVEGLTKGGSWNRPSRSRTERAPAGRKVRWARQVAA